MTEVNIAVGVAFSGQYQLVDGVVDEGKRTLVLARTPDGLASCPACIAESGRCMAITNRGSLTYQWMAGPLCVGSGSAVALPNTALLHHVS
ncbi:hypothetical protein ACQP2U_23255 [Nocardia sp. CA-084685]|uniref:hypothetical protein n=1 Tax=Nocardia sp. CA-084685 TaxID=3239970 RepID=UPI003D99436D